MEPLRKSGLTPKSIEAIELLHSVRPHAVLLVLRVNPLNLGGFHM